MERNLFKQTSYIRSLMEFNKRVLYQGTIDPNKKYTIPELQSKLFFNKIFISNMQEMFQKFNTGPIIEDYIEELGKYIKNINYIISGITNEKNSVVISREDSFEKRLSIEGKIADQIMNIPFSIKSLKTFKFLNNHIYYISLMDDGKIMISYIDMRSMVYKEVINCQMNGYKLYWKTDDCIRDYIRDKYNTIDTIAIRITTSLKNVDIITKVEYNGSTEIMKKLVSMFPDNILIVSNPFIYVDDIDGVIKQNIDITPAVLKSTFTPVDIQKIINNDLLIEYPNDSFDVYLQFLSLSAEHKDVKSIYITLYRIGKDPAIFYILRDAANRGIKVYVNIELCATGESINKMWMDEMRRVGIKVTTYECGNIKVHSKLSLVEFTNGMSIAQIGTGNYHTQTASQYTDLSLITSDSDICKQVKKVFDLLREKTDPNYINFNKSLLVTRYNMRNELYNYIYTEGCKGKDGYILIKCNSIDDPEINLHLDIAAKKGCKIDLIVRGVCTFVPNYPNGNVKVKSIIWDKLEHSRVFCFGNVNPVIYMGSLDLVTKKLDKRIETLVLVKDPDIIRKFCEYLNRYITNTKDSWIQTSSGIYLKE